MKRIIILFISVIIVYLFLNFVIHDLLLGHDLDYKIKEENNTFEIKEVLNLKKEQGVTNYYFKITNNKTTFEFKINDDFDKDMKIIKSINYYKDDNYECILPVFKNNKLPIDMMCYYKDELYFYHNLPKKSTELKEYVKDLEIYNQDNWVDEKTKTKKQGSLTLNYPNILENHYLAVDNYQGIYLINKDKLITSIKLFDEDAYETKIKALIENKYIIANYNQNYDFNEFYLVDIKNGKKENLIVNYDINFDTYVNGTYKESMFILDREDKKQYEINLQKEDAYIVGNQKGIIIYDNDNQKTVQLNLNEEQHFDEFRFENDKYDRVDQINGKYYLFEKFNSGYHVYQSPLENKENKIFLFDTTSLEDIYYADNYIYFKKGNSVLYYNDSIGTRTLFTDAEYEFNKSLKYYVYIEV